MSAHIYRPPLVLVAGPYFSGTNGDPVKIAANRARLESCCAPLFQRGYLPMIAEWLLFPISQSVGAHDAGEEAFLKLQDCVALQLLKACSSVLRIAGASRGADKDVANARALGIPVFDSLEQFPDIKPQS